MQLYFVRGIDRLVLLARLVSCDVLGISKLIHYPGSHGQPTLEPPTGYFCPNVNVTYTCHDSNVTTMTWYAEPHISGNPGIQYAPGYTNESMKKYDGFYVYW